MRAFDLVCKLPWAIRPDALGAMLEIAARAEIAPEAIAAAMTSGTPQAVSARLGRPLDNTRAVTIRDGVAIIPVSGPIFRHANLFSEVSGATSTEVLATDLHAALDNPAVTGILLEIDSPGGEVAGTAELASMIRAAGDQKPVHAYVDGLGASAAYWLASAASHITVASTALVGSIGVVSALPDPTKTTSRDVEFVSSQSPKKRANLTTEGGRAQVQAVVDALADVFVADVAQYRGVSTDTVLSDFGQGDVFVGATAVASGLADEVGTFEAAVAALAAVAAQGGGPTAAVRSSIVSENQTKPPAAEITVPVPPPAPGSSPAREAEVTALTERMAAMEAELLASKALSESQATALKAATDTVTAMKADARRARFMGEVLGKSDASGIRWIGDPEKNVAMLEHLAASAGESSDLFTGYVAQQRALAEQVRASDLFKETGSDQGGTASVLDRIEAAAAKLMAADPALTKPAAIDRVLMTDAKLAGEYLAEQRAR